jgi:hypothetical protein
MKFAIVEGQRLEAQRDLAGKCPDCGSALIAKCGEVRDWHWAHLRARDCDRWSEPETPWHRAWKNQFPASWQEISHRSERGEVHRADVKTDRGVVLEFQHSFLRRNEQESRETFYPKMLWIVDGQRRKLDRRQFFAALDAGTIINDGPRIVLIRWKEGALLRDWGASRAPVYFDFGESKPEDAIRFDTSVLWRLNPCGSNGTAYLAAVPKTLFLHVHLNGELFEETCTQTVERVAARHLLKQASRPLFGFERYLTKRRRAQARF